MNAPATPLAATLVILASLAAGAPSVASSPPSQAAPEAVVVSVAGDVRVEGPGRSAVAATVGHRLVVGDRVVPAAGARAVIVHRTGVKEAVAAPMTVAGNDGSGGGDLVTRTVRVLAQAALANARSQPNRAGMIRPIPGEPVPVAPRNGLALRTGHPTFEWMPVAGASSYTLQVRAGGQRPVRYQVGAATTWTLPDDAPALVAGREYFWTVAVGGEHARVAREQSFSVLDAERAREVAWNLEAIEKLGLDPWGDGALLTLTVFADFGLYYDAARVLETLEAQGPLAADLYLLEGEVLDALGDLDGARAAFDRAEGILP